MSKNEAGPGCLISFGLIFAAAGAGAAGLGVHGWLVCRRSAGWTEVPANVVSVEYKVRPTKGGRRARYVLMCRYTYEFGEETYASERLRATGSVTGYKTGEARSRYEELLGHQESGEPVTALVDPGDPETAILYRDGSPATYVVVPLGALFAAIGVVLLRVAASTLRERKRRDEAAGG